ncbi:hypothetical protein GGP41_000394 [Bipolaris sorokiniana]|uniref:Uncharacterized protein n=1 Tax=Cochliobolus sativus TaxID=45130 RepID=A0A8H6DQG0_COCSA|nr:hypothetical protein GGP41_000394 [Bipolaris sorokiniana]
MTLSSPFMFGSPQAFANFVSPEKKNEQNDAQNQLCARLQYLLSRTAQSKKKRFDSDMEKKWNDLLSTRLMSGYEEWWKDLKHKEIPSVIEKDVMMLGEAFGDKEWAWRLSRYPNIDQISKQLRDYGNLLLFVMRRYSATEGYIKQGHIPVNGTREDETSGGKQPLDVQPACEGSANEPSNAVGNIVSNAKRSSNGENLNGESPSRKRICLQSEQSKTSEVDNTTSKNHAVSTLVSGTGQEQHMSTSSGQKTDIVMIPAPTIPSFKPCKLLWNTQTQTSSGLSLTFQYCGQSTCDRTGDRVVEYLWSGYSAINFISYTKHELEDDEVTLYYRILPDWLDQLPFKDLTDSIRRSETWKQRQDDKRSGCLTIQLAKSHVPQLNGSSPFLHSARIKCTVSRADAPETRLFSQC